MPVPTVTRPPRRTARSAVRPCCHQSAIAPVSYNSVHYGEHWLHYEVSSAEHRTGWEIDCESRDRRLNRYLLDGFRRHLVEIKDTLGEQVEAEMWDWGWTKIYEVNPDAPLTEAYQEEVAARPAAMIICLHPIYVYLRCAVTASYRRSMLPTLAKPVLCERPG